MDTVPKSEARMAGCPGGGTSLFDVLAVLNIDTNASRAIPNCSTLSPPITSDAPLGDAKLDWLELARKIHVYLTPVIIVLGTFGNCICLKIFLTRSNRNIPAGNNLAAMSFSDLLAIVFYVFVEWIRRGWNHFNPDHSVTVLDSQGICQVTMYISYVTRFTSAWMVVLLTLERYIGICHPLEIVGTGSKLNRKLILVVFAVGILLCLFKPMVTTVHYIPGLGTPRCASEHNLASFALDSCYVILITAVPFLMILCFNCMIIRALIKRSRRYKEYNFVKTTTHTSYASEFTYTLLTISGCFLLLTLPYTIVWVKLFLQSQHFTWNGELEPSSLNDVRAAFLMTKTVFYITYCMNFVIYSLTRGFVKKEITRLFGRRQNGVNLRTFRSKSIITRDTSLV